MFDERYAHDFTLFGWVHIVVLVLGAGSIVALYYLRPYLRNPRVWRVFRFTDAILLAGAELTFQLWQARQFGANWVDIVPLGLCAMMDWITVVALLFDLPKLVRTTVPWAFTGASLSFIVVDMGHPYEFPHFRFFHYFGNHYLFLVGNLAFLFAGRFRYTYRDLVRSTLWLLPVVAVVLGIDLATGQNFMFLRDWPEELDFVNQALPFPVNTLALFVGIFALFNVFYLVVVRGRFDRNETSEPQPALTPVG